MPLSVLRVSIVVGAGACMPAFAAETVAHPMPTMLSFMPPWAGVAASAALVALAAVGVWRGVRGRRLRARRLQQIRAQAISRYGESETGAVIASLSGTVLYLNAAAESLLGIRSHEAQGAPMRALLPLWTADGKPVDPLDPSSALDPRQPLSRFTGLDSDDAISYPMPILRRGTANAYARGREPRVERGAAGEGLPLMIAPLALRDAMGVVDAVGLTLRDGRAMRTRLARDRQARHVNGATVDAIIGISPDEVIRSWNPGARTLFSFDFEDVVGESIGILVNPDRHAILSQTVKMVLSGERVIDRDLTMRSRDGREFDVSLAAFPVSLPEAAHPEDAGTATRAVIVLRDIGERRLSERRVRHLGAQLVRRAQELQAIFDIAPVGMVIADSPDCLHVRPNLALTTMLGLERAAEFSFAGGAQNGYEIWQGDALLEENDSPLHRAVRGRCAIAPTELTLRTAQREWTVMAYAAPVIDQDHSVVGAIAVFVDISAMKIVDAERQQLLADAIDARRAAEEASRLKEEFLATVSHELRTPLNAMHGWLEIMLRKTDPQTQARGLDVLRRNVRAQTRVVEDILDVSAFVKGKTRLVIRPVDLLDIARATAESLRPTAEAKSISLVVENDLPTGVAPLSDTRVPGRDAGLEAGRQRLTAAPVNGDPERIQQIAWNLLSNALKFTPEGGTVVVAVQSVQSGTMAAGPRSPTAWDPADFAVAPAASAASAASVAVVAPGAVDAMASSEMVDGLSAARGGMFVLSVTDTGEGIAPAFLPFVFDRFRQADSSIERRHSGLGLGLAIVRHLAELHGGFAAVESAGLGEGATFRVGFPARPTLRYAAVNDGDVVPSEESAASTPGGGGWYVVTSPDGGAPHTGPVSGEHSVAYKEGRLHGMRVLVVEDDQAAAEIIAEALGDEGADVRLVDDAETAIQVLSAWEPHVLVSDIGLPGRDGCALMQSVREMDPPLSTMFAVAVTAYAGVEDRARALTAGFDAYLVKPVASSQLVDMLALSGRSAVAE
ncbi:ATP-binding protein [Robbsia sp. KACC 23696]|uniref:hybrid sensor histidine kinase/response regulator n=1 Tax=Robbsia sp. KACC 23696 TaxID=3149231 RepID=UPI00325C20D2